ncbi:dihydrolipoyl dehydrogenase [Candidatus Sulfurimonas baltica]|uniref:Dihydrolipoyl dehydrogenase n=1 Tax=Candidatus Sulfurimonas baltica TaxID=2740404 RepID=A0A7S7LUX3_9BACT|nr:dihydrolipoyl dehydrogenase [Candidatus Sulfurimonas baltica]QOY51947.1 dihydrolipoyl dehydrogenase [Candidatus Sulfurimonas baltica]
MREYEVVVIGGGPGGYQAALELGKAGVKTLLIERCKERVGGTCLNLGCIPTKNYLHTASFISKIPYFEQMGLSLDYKGLNLVQLKEKTTALITEIRTGVLWMLEQSKVELFYGSASFVDANRVDVDGEIIAFEKCIIATGSHVRELPQLPIDSSSIISSDDVFKLSAIPKSIAIIGTGPIGCEFATFFSALGVDVTLIGRSTQLLPSEDEDVSKALLRVFKKSNINVLTSSTIEKVKVNKDEVELFLNDTQESIKCELVLSATGRIPNTDGVKLENSGVKKDERGFIEVSPSFQTSQEHIYAVGDCIDTPAYAHTAYAEAKIVAKNIVSNESKTNTHITPSTIFTNPQIASCGLKEREANQNGIEIEVKKAFFKVNSKAKINGDDSGFAKLVVCAKSGVILGAVIIGVEATEIIHEIVLCVEKKITMNELRAVIHAHPTVSEIITYL